MASKAFFIYGYASDRHTNRFLLNPIENDSASFGQHGSPMVPKMFAFLRKGFYEVESGNLFFVGDKYFDLNKNDLENLRKVAKSCGINCEGLPSWILLSYAE